MSTFGIDEVIEERPAYALHPVRGVVWATFWGTPVAAGIVLARNYSRLGMKTAARNATLGGIAVTVGLFGLLFAIPEGILDRIPGAALAIPQLVIASVVAKELQKDLLDEHVAKGGAIASVWRSIGIGLLCLPVTAGALLVVALLLEPSLGSVATFGNDDVYYAGDATRDDARKLARVLEELELFGSEGMSVRLESTSERVTISFVLVEDAWLDPEVLDLFRSVGQAIVDAGFPAPLQVQLCDDCFAVKETILVEKGGGGCFLAALAYENGEYEKAIELLTEAQETMPDNPSVYASRADCHSCLGDLEAALEDYERAIAIDPEYPDVRNALAWILATSREEKLRDPQRAIKLAREECERQEWKNANVLDTLAAAYAAAGNFSKAVDTQKKALELASDEGLREACQERLKLYKAGRPYCQEPEED
jgi:tetratricopeptide (TPR) repeat protein